MRRRDPFSLTRWVAQDALSGLRRLAVARAPSVRIVGHDGRARVLDPGSDEAQALLEAADELLEIARVAR